MKRNKAFWPIMTAAIFFVAGWFFNSVVSFVEHQADVRVAIVQLENQLDSIAESKQLIDGLQDDYNYLLEARHDLGEDTFQMLGGEQVLSSVVGELGFIIVIKKEQEKSYNNMAQMADPAVFNGGLPARISPAAYVGSEI